MQFICRRVAPEENATLQLYSGSEHIADRAKEPEPFAILRGVDTDAGAVAKFINVVRHVHDIEPRFQHPVVGELEALFRAEVDGIILRHACAVWNQCVACGVRQIRAQTAAVKRVGINARAAAGMGPCVSHAERAGDALVVVQRNPMGLDVGRVIRVEQELRRVPILALRL